MYLTNIIQASKQQSCTNLSLQSAKDGFSVLSHCNREGVTELVESVDAFVCARYTRTTILLNTPEMNRLIPSVKIALIMVQRPQ